MKGIIISALALVALTGCTQAQIKAAIADSEAKAGRAPVTTEAPVTTYPAGKPSCVGTVVVAEWDDPLDCDVSPPQRLDIAYPGSDGIEQEQFQERCDGSGGTLTWEGGADGMFVCHGVDY